MRTRSLLFTLVSSLVVSLLVAGCAAASSGTDEPSQEGPEAATTRAPALLIATHVNPNQPTQPSTGKEGVPQYGAGASVGTGTGTGSSSPPAPSCPAAAASAPHFCTTLFEQPSYTGAVSAETACGTWTSCENFGCNGVTGRCLTACTSAGDCASGAVCNSGQCVVVGKPAGTLAPGAVPANATGGVLTQGACLPTSISCPSGNAWQTTNTCGTVVTQDCGIYVCGTNVGTCEHSCTTTNDCAVVDGEGSVCNVGHCCPQSNPGCSQ